MYAYMAQEYIRNETYKGSSEQPLSISSCERTCPRPYKSSQFTLRTREYVLAIFFVIEHAKLKTNNKEMYSS